MSKINATSPKVEYIRKFETSVCNFWRLFSPPSNVSERTTAFAPGRCSSTPVTGWRRAIFTQSPLYLIYYSGLRLIELWLLCASWMCARERLDTQIARDIRRMILRYSSNSVKSLSDIPSDYC